MKKILYTINFLTNGGPTRVLENLVKNLNKDKYDIAIMTLIDENDRSIVEKLRNHDINVLELNYKKSLKEILASRKKIIYQINCCKPDIIHTHGIVSTMIVSSKNIVCKKITTIHNCIFDDYNYTYGKYKGIFLAYIHIMLLRRFNEVICCSKTSYDSIKKYLSRAAYVRNGIDLEKHIKGGKGDTEIRRHIRNQLGIDDGAIIYIYAGMISSLKRVNQLVNMFACNMGNNEYLVIAGDGPLREKLQQNVKDNHIIFIGFKTNIVDYLQAADVYVSYSSSEGFSISIIEALECGLLLLLSDIPSHRECFNIDSDYYIGEVFSNINFIAKKQILSKKAEEVECKFSVKEFKERYLSSLIMTNKYEKFYEVE